MQTNEGTVTFKCEGCGVRKPEAEALSSSVFVYRLFPSVLRYRGTEESARLA